jgi:GAF domain-containing protein
MSQSAWSKIGKGVLGFVRLISDVLGMARVATKWFFAESLFSTFNAAILTALLALVGVIGGIYPDDIKGSFSSILTPKFDWTVPFFHGFSSDLPWGAKLFWIALTISTIYFAIRQWAVDSVQSESTKKLQDLIKTMPPTDLMDEYSDSVEECYRFTIAAIYQANPPVRNDVVNSTQAILRWVASTAWAYDRRKRNARYAANIMLYRPVGLVDATSARVKSLLIHEVSFDFGQWKGLLYLNPELSSSTDAAGKDASLAEFALPVPLHLRKRVGAREMLKALPGAPIAIETGVSDYYRDTWTIKDWFQTEADFTAEQQEKLSSYFTDTQTKVRSFLSIPLYDAGQQAFAVLNIHSDQVDMLGASDDSIAQFVCLIQPFVEMIKDHLEALNTVSPLSNNLN